MSETTRVSYDSLLTISADWNAYEDKKATIGADKGKGILESVDVAFRTPVTNVTNEAEAVDLYNQVGAAVFNGVFNYGSDLKLRSRAVQAQRAELTNDPLKKECKMVSTLLGEDKVAAYREFRQTGLSSAEAIAQIS